MRRTEFLPFGMDRTLDTAVVRRDGCHMLWFNTNKNDPIPPHSESGTRVMEPHRQETSSRCLPQQWLFNKQETACGLLHRGGSFLNPDGSRNRHSYFGRPYDDHSNSGPGSGTRVAAAGLPKSCCPVCILKPSKALLRFLMCKYAEANPFCGMVGGIPPTALQNHSGHGNHVPQWVVCGDGPRPECCSGHEKRLVGGPILRSRREYKQTDSNSPRWALWT